MTDIKIGSKITLRGESAKKFEEDLADRNNPKNVELFKKAKGVYDGIKKVDGVKTGSELLDEICKQLREQNRYRSNYVLISILNEKLDGRVIVPEEGVDRLMKMLDNKKEDGFPSMILGEPAIFREKSEHEKGFDEGYYSARKEVYEWHERFEIEFRKVVGREKS